MRLLLFFTWYCCIFNTGLHYLAMGLEESMSNSDNFGTHFVLGFAMNPLGAWPKNSTLLLTIISKLDASVTITFNKTKNTYPVSKGQTKVLSGEIPIAMIMNGDGIEQKGIEITSTGDIVVVCSYKIRQSPPVGYLAVPTRFHGKSYVIASYENHPYFGIISVKMYTLVEIIFSSEVTYNETTYQRGQKLAIILGKLETFSISTKGNREISGTIINANNTIAVISGSQCGQRNPNCLYSMAFMTPVKGWGRGYILMPKRLGYVAKVLIYSNGTNVRIECEDERFSTGTIYHVIKLAYNGHLPCSFVCNKQCQVVQYGHKGESQSEPAMVVVQPDRHFRYRYRVEKVGIEKTLPPLTLVVKRHDRNMIRLNDRQIDNNWTNIGKDDAWKVTKNMRDFVTVRSLTKTKFGLFVKGWTTTNKGTINNYNSFSHLALGDVTSLDSAKKDTSMVDGQKKCRKTCNLLNVTVDPSNASEVSKRVSDTLSSSPRSLTADDMAIAVNLLENIVGINETSDEVAGNVLNAVNSILDASLDVLVQGQQQSNTSTRVIETLNELLGAINVTEAKPFQRTLRNLAVDVSKVNAVSFPGVTFSGAMSKDASSPLDAANIVKTHSSKAPFSSNAFTISLPQTLFNETAITYHDRSPQTVIFTLYKETKLFRTRNSSSPKDSSQRPNSYVIAGDIKRRPVSHLKTPIVLTYASLQGGNKSSTNCVFWNLTHSYWSNYGCTFQGVYEDGRVVCHCDHLTNFAMLMDINAGEATSHEEVLGIISYIGCAVSLVGLMLTIVTILLFRELRANAPTQILLNFCVSLSLALVVFIAGAERSRTSSMTGCRVAAITLHYFVLTTFMWMAISAFNMYLAFVKVLNSYFPKFMLKCSVVAWGVPIVIVVLTMAAALDDYGDAKYCRLHGVPFLVAFLAPILLILLGNSIAFVLIFHSLLKTGSKVTVDLKITGYQQARQGAAIFVLLGLTWLFGVLAYGDAKDVFQYLFCIFNSLQGLFVFLLYCLLSPGTREKYRRLCSRKIRYRIKSKSSSRSDSTSQKTRGNMVMQESHETGETF